MYEKQYQKHRPRELTCSGTQEEDDTCETVLHTVEVDVNETTRRSRRLRNSTEKMNLGIRRKRRVCTRSSPTTQTLDVPGAKYDVSATASVTVCPYKGARGAHARTQRHGTPRHPKKNRDVEQSGGQICVFHIAERSRPFQRCSLGVELRRFCGQTKSRGTPKT